ncbi:calcium-binding protein [Oscillatoria sp. FACHB-1407]|uniref:calcium-binding protein n=1 Tax=Oscillatoria sp. FACHB-1407 TaxID=2692847 RepID=UPI00168239D4|nr:calcium-binding protein [Oscillatoria sp. FACHB-1407]MBD2463032.1 calcium-binding protein [Oscillatoria sp. FACHB-1407]
MAVLRGNGRGNRLRGTRGRDSIFGLAGNDNLFGLGGGDSLDGGNGNDILDGGAGNDRLIGGRGDDIYVVNSVGDRVLERAGQGTDTVRASVSWVLADNLEKLELIGNAAINGTGNSSNNVLTGNNANNTLSGGGGNDGIFGQGGNDVLDGGVGADTMLGGAGDDIYLVDDTVDLVNEKAVNTEQQFVSIGTALPTLPDAGGSDLVQASIDYILPTDVSINGAIENLQLVGTADLAGIGNGLNNGIIGNSGSNTLSGAGGDDVLAGGAGDDFLSGGTGLDGFVYATGAFFSAGAIGLDLISDFTSGEDLIALSKTTFGLSSNVNGSLSASGDFARVSSEAFVATSNALVVYSTLTGSLYFNPNRSAAGLGVSSGDTAFALVATSLFTPPFLTASDFLVIS